MLGIILGDLYRLIHLTLKKKKKQTSERRLVGPAMKPFLDVEPT